MSGWFFGKGASGRGLFASKAFGLFVLAAVVVLVGALVLNSLLGSDGDTQDETPTAIALVTAVGFALPPLFILFGVVD